MAVYTYMNTWLDIKSMVDDMEMEANTSFSTDGDSIILRTTMYEIFKQHQREATEIVSNEPNSVSAAAEFMRKLTRKLPSLANEIGHIYALSRSLWAEVMSLLLGVFLCAVQEKYMQRMTHIDRNIRRNIDATADDSYSIIHLIKQRKREALNIDEI